MILDHGDLAAAISDAGRIIAAGARETDVRAAARSAAAEGQADLGAISRGHIAPGDQ